MMNVDSWNESRPTHDAIGSRAQRRRTVVALFGGYAFAGLMLIATTAARPAPIRIAAGLAFAVAAVVCLCAFVALLRRTAINAPNLSVRALDERELARRHEAVSRTQPVLGCAIAACALYATLAWQLPQVRLDGLLVYLLYGLFIMAAALPTSYLAWTEADPEARDDS